MNKLDISDTLIERPVTFRLRRRRYSIYPLSLGKIQLCSRLIEVLGFNKVSDDLALYTLALKTAMRDREQCARLLSYMTLPGSECLDETSVRERIRRLGKAKPSALATLLVFALSMDKTEGIMREFGMDKESRRLSDVMRVKERSKSDGSVSFGGKSIWGTLVDSACERYGWTYQYVLWDISYSALRLLLADHIKTVFLSDEEMRRIPASARVSTVVNASDAKSLDDLIKTQSWK